MKKPSLALLALFPVAAIAADVPSFPKFTPPFSFPKWESGQIPRSLKEQPTPPLTTTNENITPQSRPATAPSPKLISRMPVVAASEVDPKMVHAPTPGIDYKLIVKTPAVEPAR